MRSAIDLQVFEKISDFAAWRLDLGNASSVPAGEIEHAGSKGVGFVPTMGALHSGHARLIERAREQCGAVVVSIFVNPLQFGPNEDFDRYPRTFAADLDLCRQMGVDAVFHPAVEELYPRPLAEQTMVHPPQSLTGRLCGKFRPGHFEGVATIVLKLLEAVRPHTAYFGQKDYQQLTIIRRMVDDFRLPLKIVGVPTVREADGLALSSRNVYLTPEQRTQAPVLYRTLKETGEAALAGRLSLEQALARGRTAIEAIPGVDVQYLEACHAHTLEPLSAAARPMVVLVAARFGAVRLIDNILFE